MSPRRTMKASIACGSILAGMVLMPGCDPPGRPTHAVAEELDSQASFETIYQANCAGCHGNNGTHGAARPMNDPLYLHVAPPETLLDVITHGTGPGTLMPAFHQADGSGLPPEKLAALVSDMRQYWGTPSQFQGQSFPSYASTSKGDAARGATVYQQSCAQCHGPNGDGGANGGSIVDEVYLQLVSDQALRSAVIFGRIDLGMPDYRTQRAGSPLSDREIDDVVAWMISHRADFKNPTDYVPEE
ncbi:MAG: cytochrome C [Phycisphaerae bacterium]|nr:cytochrome C [Phycisphaerae bacterium]